MDLTPGVEIEQRIERLRGRMAELSWDAALVMLRADLFYFSGTAQNGVLLIPAAEEPVLLVRKSLPRAQAESPLARVHPFRSVAKLAEALSGIGRFPMGTVGLEMDVVPADIYLHLVRQYPNTKWVDASGILREIRMVKSPYEIQRVWKSARQLTALFDQVPEVLRAGMREIDVGADCESTLRRLGHQGTVRSHGWNNDSHYGPVSSGPIAAHHHAFDGPVGTQGLYAAVPQGPGNRLILPNETVMMDYVSGYSGYHADETRVFSIGPVERRMEEAHAFALSVLRKVEEKLRPGERCSEIYESVMAGVEGHPFAPCFMGHGDNQVRFLGHGVGLELDELPVVAGRFETPLEPGMVLAVEPKVFIPEVGGAGIENTYLITEDGFENLTPNEEAIVDCAGRG